MTVLLEFWRTFNFCVPVTLKLNVQKREDIKKSVSTKNITIYTN